MLKCWLELLAEFGWQVPLEEATWCTTASDTNTHWRVAIDSQTVPRSSRKKGFEALGVVLTFDNSCELELEARIASAWRAFYKFKHVLCCRGADIGRRYKLLFTLVQTALCWCWSSWNLTVTQLSKIRGVQQSVMRKMLCLHREKRVNSEREACREGLGLALPSECLLLGRPCCKNAGLRPETAHSLTIEVQKLALDTQRL